MSEAQPCKLYESTTMRELTGETIRPGGFFLTDRALASCPISAGAKVLDVGCGSGATVAYLRQKYGLEAVGVDPSELLLAVGKQQHADLPLFKGAGEALPFEHSSMEMVMAECTLSLMNNLDQTLGELQRVLRPGGWLVANDVYARNPAGIPALQQLAVSSCLRGAESKDYLLTKLAEHNFQVVLWEDHTNLLKQLIFQLIMTHGSMTEFWLKTASCSIDPQQAQLAMSQVKMGYFMLVARKK